jgi:hypothetical protein
MQTDSGVDGGGKHEDPMRRQSYHAPVIMVCELDVRFKRHICLRPLISDHRNPAASALLLIRYRVSKQSMAGEDAVGQISPSSTCAASFSRSNTSTEGVWDATKVPFEKHIQLCKDLEYCRTEEKTPHLQSHASIQTLPDAPRIRLDCQSSILEYCIADLDTPGMNKLGDRLWWAGPTLVVVPLSQHTVLERRIQITEDPSVHLLWIEGILYLKPIPAYLTSFAFWELLMDTTGGDTSSDERSRLIATCLGFLKTYASLVQRRSDFNFARKHGLLGSLGDVTFESFIAFIASFDGVPELATSSRWRFGLIQLDALNFHSAIYLRRWHLNRFEARWTVYFSRFFPIILFVFAGFSVMLSAMQVIVAAKQMSDTDNSEFKRMLNIFIWFGIEAIGWSIGFSAFLLFGWVGIMTNEIWNGRKMQRKIKKRLKRDGVHP